MASEVKLELSDFYPFNDNGNMENLIQDYCKLIGADSADFQFIFNSGVSIMHLNCCSLTAKFDEIETFLHMFEKLPSIIAFTESWIKPTSCIPNLYQNNAFHKPRTNDKRGGGISIFVDPNIPCKIADSNIITTTFEYHRLILNFGTASILLLVIYRPPHLCTLAFFDEFETLYEHIQTKSGCSQVILCGDFNVDLLQDNDSTKSLLHCFSSFALFPVIFYLKRISSHKTSLLDNIFINFPFPLFSRSGVLAVDISDHLPIYLKLSIDLDKKNSLPCN